VFAQPDVPEAVEGAHPSSEDHLPSAAVCVPDDQSMALGVVRNGRVTKRQEMGISRQPGRKMHDTRMQDRLTLTHHSLAP
jgi:hypothetical protein